MITAAKLRHTITFQAYTEAQDDYGQLIKTWATLGTRRAQIEPLSGRELEIARKINALTTHRVTIRYLANLAPKHRIIFGSRTFEILEVLTLNEIKYEQQVLCEEKV